MLLDRKIEIYAPGNISQDSYGSVLVENAIIRHRRANVRSLGGGFAIGTGLPEENADIDFTVRYPGLADIDTTWRILYDQNEYEIISVVEPYGRKQFLRIKARRKS